MFTVLISMVLSLTSCTSFHPAELGRVPYVKKDSWVPEGYSEELLAPAEYKLFYQTYRKAEWSEMKHLAIYRAAELCQELGFSHFTISNLEKDEQIERQNHNEVHGAIGTVGSSSSLLYGGNTVVEVKGAVFPSFVMEHKIKTLSFTINMSTEASVATYSASDILSVTDPK